LPKVFPYPGKQDSIVPTRGKEKFVKTLQALSEGKEKVFMSFQDGEHGFDSSDQLTLDTPWLKEGLEFVTETWLI
jgi:hypothetical protein